ncbi:MAG: DUF1992 domain-containing protein [Hyphomicrobium sp.]|nr:DUF1992 domain-containing protein [Hyphomicrobium sp.]
MSFESLAESRIQDAMDAGLFDNLRGAGKPLSSLDDDKLAGDNWMGFHVLRNGGMLPAWLDLAKEIELDLIALKRVDARHQLLADRAQAGGLTKSVEAALITTRREYADFARRIRAKQDQFNMDAPSIGLERPGIWIEHELERLDARIAGARRPK